MLCANISVACWEEGVITIPAPGQEERLCRGDGWRDGWGHGRKSRLRGFIFHRVNQAELELWSWLGLWIFL